ncbi:MAG TPA: Gfo/Idh/MocA family oxidoreductase [Tepidisphaeraceae bacterium]|nr:Gfo/Idh/MocA family oxidoreductase [Tepidisphaeraceae bacterium]
MAGDLTRRGFIQGAALAGAAAMMGSVQAADEAREPIMLAMVGCAHIHVPGFINQINRRNDVKVKSVWDHDTARAERRAKELKAQVVQDVNAIWNDPQIKAVIICSETNRHPELILGAAKAGKHMFAEKPLGITGKESFEMAAAIEKANLLFTTGYFSRTLSHYLFVKEQVQKGTLGKITRVRGSNCHSGSLGHWFDTEWRWMADPKIAGVGAFGDLGTHLLDILMWLVGDVESVTADIKVVLGNYGDCDESGEALIRFKNGITGTLAAGWVDVADPVSLIVSGTEGHIAIMNGRVYFKQDKIEGANGSTPWKEMPKTQPLPLDLFFNAVGGQSNQPLVTPREAAARVAVMEAMYRASKEKAWVTVG